MGVVEEGENQVVGLGVVLLIVAVLVVAAVAVMGLPKFFAWLSAKWKAIFGAVPEWLTPGWWSAFLAKLSGKMHLEFGSPLLATFGKWGDALDKANAPGDGDGTDGQGASVHVHATVGEMEQPQPDSVESYGG